MCFRRALWYHRHHAIHNTWLLTISDERDSLCSPSHRLTHNQAADTVLVVSPSQQSLQRHLMEENSNFKADERECFVHEGQSKSTKGKPLSWEHVSADKVRWDKEIKSDVMRKERVEEGKVEWSKAVHDQKWMQNFIQIWTHRHWAVVQPSYHIQEPVLKL